MDNKVFNLDVTDTKMRCPVGEKTFKQNLEAGSIPVLSCEGGCIRGEIARQAANMLAKEDQMSRGCIGELLTVPGSAMSKWATEAGQVVLIDGCFLRCMGRVLENHIDKDRLVQFDALLLYKKYTDRFEIDSVPEDERLETARKVADEIAKQLGIEREDVKEEVEVKKEAEMSECGCG